jgi:predicted DNA binding CopG/RHH family protein
MKKSTLNYSDGGIGDFRIVEDFLPSPDKLVLKDDAVKVTLAFSRQSIDFFKREANRNKVSYQKMIRALVDAYAARHKE